MRTDPSVHDASMPRQFRVEPGEPLTRSMQPLLQEVRCALLHLSRLGEATVIDLRYVSRSTASTTGVAERH